MWFLFRRGPRRRAVVHLVPAAGTDVGGHGRGSGCVGGPRGRRREGRLCREPEPLCGAQRIQAFPTLRFFKDGKQYGLDYRQDRTVQALTAFLKQKVELEKTMEDWCRLGVANDG